MKYFKLLLIAFVSFILIGCGDEEPELVYPISTSFVQSEDKDDIEIYTNVNGTVSTLSADDSNLDEDEIFSDIDTEGSFTTIKI